LIRYNYKALRQLKKDFRLVNEDIKRITGLKSITSVNLRMNGKIELTATQIAALCNATEIIAYKKRDLELSFYKPTDFYVVVEE
jgi:hypothetical protein